MSFNFRTEEYYKKFIELQEKLRKSEEERLKLEMKFNEMLRVTREEEQMHYRKLRSQYKRFLEEDRRRQDRNERILRTLERIENRVAMLMAKTERFKLLRQQYQMFLDRVCKMDQVKPSEVTSVPKETQYENPSQPVEEQGDVVKNYLQNVSSQRLRNLVHNSEETGPRLPFPIKTDVNVRDDDFYNLSESDSRPNYASSIAEDIMSSIQSRYYNKPIKDLRTRELNNNLQSNKPELTKPKYDGDNEIRPYPRGFGKSFLEKASADSDTEDLSEPQNAYYSRTAKSELLPKKSQNNVDSPHFSDIYLNNNNQHTDKNVITTPQDNKEKVMITEKDNRGHQNRQENQIDDTVRFMEDNKKMDNEKNQPEHVISKIIEKKLEEKQVSSQKEKETRPYDYENYEEKEIEKPTYRKQTSVENGHRLVPAEDESVNNQHFEETSHVEQPIMEPLEEIRPEPEKPEKKFEPSSLPHLEEQPAEAPLTLQTHDEDIPPTSSHTSDQKPVDINEDRQQYSDYKENPQPEEQQSSQEYVEPHQPVASGQYFEDPARQPQVEYDNQNLVQNNQDFNAELYHHQYDEGDQLVQQYDENGQPLQQYDDQGQFVQQYDETGQPIQQYDETGQPLQHYDQPQYDEHGQPIQQYEGQYLQQYDENGQPYPQYDDQGQYLQQYDDQGQFLQQYDENGQLIPQYDENGQLLQQYEGGDQQYQQFDDSGQMMQQYEMGAEQDLVQSSEQVDQPQAYSEPQEPKEEEVGIKEEVIIDKVAEQEVVKASGRKESEDVVATKPSNVMEMLDTDTESVKQETKVSNDSDFDFSNS